MVAEKKTIANGEASTCPDCHDAGTIRHWSDVSYFEDRRVCPSCEAGRAVESRIADILRRAQLVQRLSNR
jgi:RNA polymerase subunit RPABC4/transcription elongation factor Spt4